MEIDCEDVCACDWCVDIANDVGIVVFDATVSDDDDDDDGNVEVEEEEKVAEGEVGDSEDREDEDKALTVQLAFDGVGWRIEVAVVEFTYAVLVRVL